MIKSVKVTNYLGESITIEMGFPEKSGFSIQSIEGLGPSKASINSTELSTSDGSLYNSSRLTARNIVFTFKLLPNPSIEDTRQKSYKYFPIKKRVTLLIDSDNRRCETYGYVESNEPNFFSNMTTTQISIICPDPYFYSTDKNETVFSGIESGLEFPFFNDSVSNSIIEIGNIIINREQTIYYNGDSEIGVIIHIHALGPAENLSIYNSGTRESMTIDTSRLEDLTGEGIVAGDNITISTIKGKKYIQLLRDGEYINILNCLDKDSDWFQLVKGDNVFAFIADSGITNLQFKVDNQIIYEGV